VIGPYAIMAEEGGGTLGEFLAGVLSTLSVDFIVMGSGVVSHIYHGEHLVPFSLGIAVSGMFIPLVAKDPGLPWLNPVVIASSRSTARRKQWRTGVPYAYLEDVPGKLLAAIERVVGEFTYDVENLASVEDAVKKPYVFALRGNLKVLSHTLFPNLPPDVRAYEIYAEKYLPIDFFYYMPAGWPLC